MAWGEIDQIGRLQARHAELLDHEKIGAEFIFPPERKLQTSYYLSPDEGVVLVGCSNNPWLSREIAGHLNFRLVEQEDGRHPNHEDRVRIPFNICDKRVVVVASPGGHEVNNELIEAMAIGDAATRNFGVQRQIVLSKFPYDRQERQSFGEREPIMSADVIRILTEIARYERIMSLDVHQEAIMGTATVPWDRMYVTPLLAERIQAWGLPNPKIVSPDAGFVKGAYHYASFLKAPYTNINKYRDPVTGEVTMNGVSDEVAGFNCVIVDDVISSGTTMITAAELLLERGAQSVSIAAAHGEFAKSGRGKLYESPAIQHILTTNTLPQYPEHLAALGMNDKFEIVSVGRLLAEAIRVRLNGGSIKNDIYKNRGWNGT